MGVDVLGLGSVTVDDFFLIDQYPPADSKMPISGRYQQVGGLAATALVTAARLGCSAAYAGTLGSDALSQIVEAGLVAQGIDLSGAVRRDDARPIHALVMVASDPPTRTIFFERGVHYGADPDLPDAAVIRAARVLLVDNWGVEGMLRAARIARAAGRPVVGDFEFSESPYFADLLAVTDHLIVSQRFAARLLNVTDPAEQARRLWNPDRATVVITCGADGAWYLGADPGGDSGAGATVVHQPAFPVQTVDSTGCGDVFHGAYAAGLVRGLGLVDRVRLAAAAAAMKATQPGGQAGIPTAAAIAAFLADRMG